MYIVHKTVHTYHYSKQVYTTLQVLTTLCTTSQQSTHLHKNVHKSSQLYNLTKLHRTSQHSVFTTLYKTLQNWQLVTQLNQKKTYNTFNLQTHCTTLDITLHDLTKFYTTVHNFTEP